MLNNIHAVVLAAGSGSRMASSTPKQYLTIADKYLFEYSLAAMLQVKQLTSINLISSPEGNFPKVELDTKVKHLTIGGLTRAQSVQNALNYLIQHYNPQDWVLIHDAARCLITATLIENLITSCLKQQQGGLLAIPLADTLKQTNQQKQAQQTINRANKWLAQTPQMFRLGELLEALNQALMQGQEITDEASAIELSGKQPNLVLGSKFNFKVTYPEDLELAKIILQR